MRLPRSDVRCHGAGLYDVFLRVLAPVQCQLQHSQICSPWSVEQLRCDFLQGGFVQFLSPTDEGAPPNDCQADCQGAARYRITRMANTALALCPWWMAQAQWMPLWMALCHSTACPWPIHGATGPYTGPVDGACTCIRHCVACSLPPRRQWSSAPANRRVVLFCLSCPVYLSPLPTPTPMQCSRIAHSRHARSLPWMMDDWVRTVAGVGVASVGNSTRRRRRRRRRLT